MGSKRRLAGGLLAVIGGLTLAMVSACAAPQSAAPASAPTASALAAPAARRARGGRLRHGPRNQGDAACLRREGPRSGVRRSRLLQSQGGTLPALRETQPGSAAGRTAGQAVDASHPDHVVGDGTSASCTSAAVVAAVAAGGVITFSCGPAPVAITMTATATVASSSHQVVLDGGGKVTLSGGGTTEILSMNAGWQQQWPQLVVQNLAFTDAYSGTQQTTGSSVYGGGAIFDEGGQLKVVNSAFTGDSCYASGPDLGGGAIRAVGMYPSSPVYITHDTFSGNSCSNGGALSGLYAHFDVINSLLDGNKAIGWGANPASAGMPGGGSGGAIYTDGNQYDLSVSGTVMRDNTAREGGGGIFFVVNSGGGTLTIDSSTLQGNTSGEFQNAPGIFDSVNGQDTQPVVTGSAVA